MQGLLSLGSLAGSASVRPAKTPWLRALVRRC